MTTDDWDDVVRTLLHPPNAERDEGAWQAFERLAAREERIGALLETLPPLDAGRFRSLAIALGKLVGPVVWSPAEDEARVAAVRALDVVLVHMCPDVDVIASSPAVVTGTSAHAAEAGWDVTRLGRDLLRTPCRRDDATKVARLVSVGHRLFRGALRASGPFEGLEAARHTRYEVAFSRYADAARGLNDALGEVAFVGLDAPL